jgi:hypothetical protein
MNDAQLKNIAAPVKGLASKGKIHIASLKDLIIQRFGDHLEVVSDTPYSIKVSFYGFRLVFRIEIRWVADQTNANIAAYSLSYDVEPTETLLVMYPFDNLGNIKNKYLSNEFGIPLLVEVFTLLRQVGAVLRP